MIDLNRAIQIKDSKRGYPDIPIPLTENKDVPIFSVKVLEADLHLHAECMLDQSYTLYSKGDICIEAEMIKRLKREIYWILYGELKKRLNILFYDAFAQTLSFRQYELLESVKKRLDEIFPKEPC
jgi:hypothetical protein